ncbi:MAG: macro domain-containing protein [Anaerolineae bacterium]|nr:macro domain-containing protein [Anaerolineae bacterium]MCA9890757.1 macro domain-containing protein [Anaerolineae bacterium]
MKAKVRKLTIHLVQDDVQTVKADAIVVMSDPILALPKGFSQSESLLRDVTLAGWCDVGRAVNIPTKGAIQPSQLIFAIPPKWGESNARGKLANTIWAVLELAESIQVRELAVPAIGTGKYGYPVEAAANFMIEQILDFSFEPTKHLRRILICLSTDVAYTAFTDEWNRQFQSYNDSEESGASAH